MPDLTQSEAIREARAICPTNLREIETLEIRQGTQVFQKKTLELALIFCSMDYAGGTPEKTFKDCFLESFAQINSNLQEKYSRIKYSVTYVNSTGGVFYLTGNGFTTYRKAREYIEAMELDGPLDTWVVSTLPAVTNNLKYNYWTPGAKVRRAILFCYPVSSTQYEGGPTVPKILTTGQISVSMAADPKGRFFQPGTAGGGTTGAKWPNGEIIMTSGFSFSENNGTFQVVNSISDNAFSVSSVGGGPTLQLVAESLFDHPQQKRIESVATKTNAWAGDSSEMNDLVLENEVQIYLFGTDGGSQFNTAISTSGGAVWNPPWPSDRAQFLIEKFSETFNDGQDVNPGEGVFYLVNDNAPFSAKLETGELIEFQNRNFAINITGTGEDGTRAINITIDNSDKEVSKYVAKVKKRAVPLELTFRVYLSNDLEGPQNVPIKLFITDVETRGSTVSGQAKWIDIINAPFPNAYYLRKNFPTL